MSRPGKPLTRKGIQLDNKLKALEKDDRKGNSLLAVLDMEDELPEKRAELPEDWDHFNILLENLLHRY